MVDKIRKDYRIEMTTWEMDYFTLRKIASDCQGSYSQRSWFDYLGMGLWNQSFESSQVTMMCSLA